MQESAQSERSGQIHVFEPGETVHLGWTEFVSHPGYFRISFDEDGDDDFVDPAGCSNSTRIPRFSLTSYLIGRF